MRDVGYAKDEPVIVGLDVGGELTVHAQARAPDKVYYAASLSKQIAAACVAILVNRGVVDVDSPISRWLPELPSWADTVLVRHLIHHVGGTPHPNVWRTKTASTEYTNSAILSAVARCLDLEETPGTTYRYSSTGYSLLGTIVTRAVDEPLTTWADSEIFDRLQMTHTQFWDGPGLAPPGVTPMIPDQPAPHSLGDGGMWTTASDLLRWNRALANDELGVTDRMHQPGRFPDGSSIGYAWGVGVREHCGRRVYLHGGSLGDVNSKLVRWHGSTDSVLVTALADTTERWLGLTDRLMDHVADAGRN